MSVALVRRAAIATLVLASSLVALPADAAGSGSLPFDTYFEMAVDDAHGYVFVSGGPGTDDLAVFDANAILVATLPMPGASGMILLGTELFVARADAPDVAVIDTTLDPPALDRTIEVGSFTQPTDLTFVNDRLWFFTATGLATTRLDGSGLAGPYPTGVFPEADQRFVEGAPPDELMIWSMGGSEMRRFETSVPPGPIEWESDLGGAANLGAMAMVPGRASFVVAGGAPYEFPEVRLADGAELRSYGASHYPRAVAVTPAHGGLVAGAVTSSSPEVYVYRTGRTGEIWTHDFGVLDEDVVHSGLAWSEDGDRLFVVTGDYYTASTFHVVEPAGLPTVASSAVSIVPSAREVPVGDPIDITVHLDGGATNRAVKIYAHPVDGTRTLIASGDVDDDGDFLVTGYVPPRRTTLTAVFDGDDAWGRYVAATDVTVRSRTTARLKGWIAGSGDYPRYAPNTPVEIVGRVAPSLGGGWATLVLERKVDGDWRRTRGAWIYEADGTAEIVVGPFRAGSRWRARVISVGTWAYSASRSTWQSFHIARVA